VPLRDVRGEIVGVVGVSHDITRRKLAEQELQRRTNEMETDVLMARQVQETFLPRAFPVFPRGVPLESSALRFAYRYIPATTLGGDFFDIVQLSNTKCGMLVCDVMGHGVRAGLLTALIRGVVGELRRRAENPAEVLAEIIFATAFYGVVDTAANTLTYGNAGHPAPLIRRGASGSVVRLASSNPEPAAGLIADFGYTQVECSFNPGDLLLGYTDGVVEAPDPSGQLYGEAHLATFLQDSIGIGGEELCAKLVRDLARFSTRTVFDDDVCMVTVESTGTTCAVPMVSYEI
jgi:phosphoserine phosphatase RsbU/P